CRGVYVGWSCFGGCRSCLRICARGLLYGDRSSLEAVLAFGRLLEFKQRHRARALFWDFWKNLALAAGFLLIVFRTDASSIAQFFAQPTVQPHPYLLTDTGTRAALNRKPHLSLHTGISRPMPSAYVPARERCPMCS